MVLGYAEIKLLVKPQDSTAPLIDTTMIDATPTPSNHDVRPPSQHQLAFMIWLAVFPTLTVLNLTIGHLLRDLSVILRALVLATIAVPIVMYGLMSHLHRLGARIVTIRNGS